MGQPEAGLAALSEALALVETTGERYYEAELHRLKGALLLQHAAPEVSHAETCFQQALDIACRHEPGSPVAAAGEVYRGLRAPGPDLRLVHRGI